MYQQIFKDTLGGRFIKALLSETALPLHVSVSPGDLLVQNHFYYYRSYIIKCTRSGILGDLSDTGAQFEQLRLFDEEDKQNAYKYISYANYYDPDTHHQLGNYLRYYKSKTGINLFPYYNCYCNHSLPDVQLEKSETQITAKSVTTQTEKVIGFPILANKRYSISIDSNSEVLLRCTIRNSNGHVADSTVGCNLEGSSMILTKTRFDEPFDYMFTPSTEQLEKVLAQQKNLWLIIQLPSNNESSVVVYEDCFFDYSHLTNSVHCTPDSVYVRGALNPSLTLINSHESYAFSDRLIEYLLNNVITQDNSQQNNFGKAQKAIIRQSSEWTANQIIEKCSEVKNIWSDDISREVYDMSKEFSKDNFFLDQDGYINKDVERKIFTRKGDDY